MLDEIIVEEKNGVKKLAGLFEGCLREFVLTDDKKANEGNIYIGKIVKKINTANGKGGYFLNIGCGREVFLNAEEHFLEPLEASEGQDVIVQVSQEQRDEKGARMTRFLHLAGVYLVYNPYGDEIEVSTKIDDEDLRDSLGQLIDENTEDGGWVVRTFAKQAKKEDILAEIKELKNKFEDIMSMAKKSKAPCLLMAKDNVIEEMICRNADSLKKVIVNNHLLEEKFKNTVSVEYDAKAFENAGIYEMLAEALQKSIKLKSGGRIFIEETKAFVAIDVDSGEGDAQGGFAKLNIEAAKEIAKQIVLRNLAGKIIIDFAGISEYRFLKNAMDVLEQCLAGDMAKARVLGLSRAGNVEIVRNRRRPSLSNLLMKECEVCSGIGKVEK